MRLTKEDKAVLTYTGLLAVTLLLLVMVFQIRDRGSSIVESPRLLPLIVVGCMLLLCAGGLLRALRDGGRPAFAKIGASLKDAVQTKQTRAVWLAIGLVAVYIFVGIQTIGFYASSAVLIVGITLGYVKRIKPVWAILISLALTGLLYLIFAVAFSMRLR